ncbi:ATP-binding cassette domain-containing protein [Mangrovibrevibacter kandeliae]|uniref:ATP-binding cassette domain-containing protein n=1 Tax=Mangrovibrevibacter kandeliae TaxID=2968473 RepID=UPI002117F5CA|nr:dipeptide/oligopeptide/nickel ABC transporter ATP-binding protein [Aurantimonas sp. CSK15Z-1]
MTPPLLEVRAVSRRYAGVRGAPEIQALDDVSLTLERGEVLGLVGESGSGKSTLARLILGLGSPSSGSVLLQGHDIHAARGTALRRLRRDVQMVFQDPYGSLDPRQRVARIVAEPLHLLDGWTREQKRQRSIEVLGAVGLGEDALDRFPHEFSGGQRQRIAIARAIICRPKLLVADEAVASLDPSVQAQILNLLIDLQETEDLAILFIAHDLAAVAAVADRIAVMKDGRVIETGRRDEVLSRPMQKFTELLAAAAFGGGTRSTIL